MCEHDPAFREHIAARQFERPRTPRGHRETRSTTLVFKQPQAGLTGLEPAASGVTDRHSNQTELQPLFCCPAGSQLPTDTLTGNRTPISTLKEWCPNR